jgi:hypothetical protein
MCTFEKKRRTEVEERRAESLTVVEFVKKRLGIEPDEQQIQVLTSEAKRGILNCSRQWGKSTMAAAKAVHRVYTRRKQLVLVASPTRRQSAELVMKAEEMLVRLGVTLRGDGINSPSLVLPNGSRIVGLPSLPGKLRAFSAVSLLLIDEAAQVEDSLYRALRPMLAVSDGDLWMMSTPYGKRGFFYESWAHGRANWARVSVPATECPRIPKEFLEEERAELGSLYFQQEYMCEFVDSGAGVFGRDLVERALDDEIAPLGGFGTWK